MDTAVDHAGAVGILPLECLFQQLVVCRCYIHLHAIHRYAGIFQQLYLVVEVLQHVVCGQCSGFYRCTHTLCLGEDLAECVAVQLRNRLCNLKPLLNVGDGNGHVGFVHVHGINGKFNVTVVIQHLDFVVVVIGAGVETGSGAVVILIAADGKFREFQLLAVYDLNITVGLEQPVGFQFHSVHVNDVLTENVSVFQFCHS